MGISVITARLLGPAGRGWFYSSSQTSGLVNTVGTLSMGESLIYHIGSGKILINQVFGTVLMLIAGFTVILLPALYLLLPILTQHFLSEVPEGIIPLIFILIPITMTEYFSTSALKGLKMFNVVNKLTIITRATILLLMFMALEFYSADIYTAILSYTIAISFNAVLYLVVLFYFSKLDISVSWNEFINIY